MCVSVYVSLPTCVNYFMHMCMNTADFHMHVSDYISVCALAVYTISVMFTISVKGFTISVCIVIFVSHGQRDTWHRPADILLIFSQKLEKPSDARKCVCVPCIMYRHVCVGTVFGGTSTYKGGSLAFRIIYVVWLFVLQSKHLSPPIRLNDSTEPS